MNVSTRSEGSAASTESGAMQGLERHRGFWNSEESVERYDVTPRLNPGEARVLAHCFGGAARGHRVLDLGCGAGRTTYFLQQMGMHAVGLDIAPKLLERGRARLPDVDFREGSADALDFEDHEFDAVIYIANGLDCLFPLESRRRCLKEIHRVLKPRGYFLASHHNLPALALGWYRMMRPWKLHLRLTNILNGNIFRRACYISHPRDSGGLPMRYMWSNDFIREVEGEGFTYEAMFANSGILHLLQRTCRTPTFTKLADPWPTYAFRRTTDQKLAGGATRSTSI